MKRILALALGFLMTFSVPALSEEFDLSSMSFDELVELRNRIDAEIGSPIGTGQYIVGEDIEAGKYEFICTFVNIQASASGGAGYNLSRLALWTELSEVGEELMDINHINKDQLFMIDLQDGNVLLIKDVNFVIRPYSLDFAK